MRITVGGRGAKASWAPAPPIRPASSSWTILTTCWPGLSWPMTSAPSARSFTREVNSLTTRKLTSASSSARRISRIALLTSSSVRVPRPRTSARVSWSRSERASNTVLQEYGQPYRFERARGLRSADRQAQTRHLPAARALAGAAVVLRAHHAAGHGSRPGGHAPRVPGARRDGLPAAPARAVRARADPRPARRRHPRPLPHAGRRGLVAVRAGAARRRPDLQGPRLPARAAPARAALAGAAARR